jgi:hypothetical protein
MHRSTALALLLALWGCTPEPVDVGAQADAVAARGGGHSSHSDKGHGRGHDDRGHGHGSSHGSSHGHGHGHGCGGDDDDDTGETPAACSVALTPDAVVLTSVDSEYDLLGAGRVTVTGTGTSHVRVNRAPAWVDAAALAEGVVSFDEADFVSDESIDYDVCCDDAETSCTPGAVEFSTPAA